MSLTSVRLSVSTNENNLIMPYDSKRAINILAFLIVFMNNFVAELLLFI